MAVRGLLLLAPDGRPAVVPFSKRDLSAPREMFYNTAEQSVSSSGDKGRSSQHPG